MRQAKMELSIPLFLATAFCCAGAQAERTFLEQLEGSAAECSIIGSSAKTEAFLVGRDQGQRSAKYKSLVAKAFQDAQACVDKNKPAMKPYFKAEIVSRPGIKAALTDTYAAWLGYMDWLGNPHDFGDVSAEKRAFEASANRLRAEIEAM
jgi:hypothetical protein